MGVLEGSGLCSDLGNGHGAVVPLSQSQLSHWALGLRVRSPAVQRQWQML